MTSKTFTNTNQSILIVANYSTETGYAWQNIYRLFNAIGRKMHNHDVGVCFSAVRITNSISIFDEDIPYESFIFDPLNITFSSLLHLKKMIKLHRIKYVYLTDHKAWDWFYALLRLWGVRKIIIHNRISVPSPYPAPAETGIRRHMKSLLCRSRVLSADVIYAVSNFVRQRLIQQNCCPPQKVVKLLNGIDIDRFSCQTDSSHRDKTLIFACSRASRHKGIHNLIGAAKILRDHYKLEDFVIEYAGDGPDLDAFMESVEQLGLTDHFLFLGKLNNTMEKTCYADIVVVPSMWGDACPSAVMEAMAAGKALVTTRAGGIPEIVGGSDNAYLVPPSDVELMAKALAELIADEALRQRFGVNARKRVEQALEQTCYHTMVTDRLLNDLEVKHQ